MRDEERELFHNLAQRIMSVDPELAERAKAMRPRAELQPFVEGVQATTEATLEGLEAGINEELALETVVVREGRPVLLVEKDDYRLEGPESEVWKDRLDLPKIRKAMRRIIPAIGRIEVENHPSYTWVGTGWLVDDDVIVTNRHVAELFAIHNANGFIFRKGWPDTNVQMKARVDFREENETSQPNEFAVLDIIYIEEDSGPDIAFLKIKKKSSKGQLLAGKLRFASQQATAEQFVATIGYPAADSRVPDQDLVRRLFGDVYNVKRMAPGQILSPRDGLVLHDCSTLGGNSGSPIVDLATGEAVGLHYSGLFMRENRGVPATVVEDRLAKVRNGKVFNVPARVSRAAQEIQPNLQAVQSEGQTTRFNVTVPIEVSVRVGSVQSADISGFVAGSTAATTIEQAVDQARAQLISLPSVLKVYDGYAFRDGWITDERAVVVVVRDTAIVSAESLGVPAAIGGFPVEIRLAGPDDYAESLNLIEALEGFPQTTYTPPDNVELDLVEDEMKVICHLCPDAGWPTLRDFLSETKKRLTIGMYDFTAPHIVDGVLTAVDRQSRKLALVLQQKASLGGHGTKRFDIPEEDTVADYDVKLADRFDFAWASVGKGHRFASSYHIKVAVRDGKAFWLSSGNWQSSNQPEREIATSDEGWNLLMKHNREWNVVIENTELAKQFEKFLKHDLKQAKTDAALEAPELPELTFLVEEAPELERVPSGSPTYFEPLVVERSVRVQPLLTPDNYQDQVLSLIQNADEQILFQNQSFSILRESRNDTRFEALFDALLERQEEGVDVRIIIRGEFNPQKYVEALKKRGFDTNRVRLQDRCHTKGIIVDRKAVLVGSHNWTNQGTLVNRDASLIIFDKEIAKYFAKAFWFDWKKLARKSVSGARRIRLADGREAPPAGMEMISWQETQL